MPYRFLEEIAIADVAFEATGKTLAELFEAAAMAVTGTMVSNVEKIESRIDKSFKMEGENVEMLLFNYLQELIFFKDSEQLLFSGYSLDIRREEDKWRLVARVSGEKIDPGRHEMIVDVKAVSLHRYNVEETPAGWRAEVILDV